MSIVKVSFVGDIKDLEAKLAKLGRKTKETESQLDRVGDGMAKWGARGVAGSAVAAVGLAKLGQAAGELEQAVGGTEAVFGEASKTIDKFAKDSAKNMGLSEKAFRESTTRLGGSLKALGFEADEAAERSVRLTGVAADLAATYGGTTAEAVDALAAAFRGEADPAERFNLRLNQTAVNAKAVELGLARSTSEVSAQAKSQATLALIMEQSADAQGQFARESDTLIGKQAIAKAQFDNLTASIGAGVLPVMTSLLDKVTAVTSYLDGLDGSTKEVIGTFATAAVGTAAVVSGLTFLAGQAIKARDAIVAVNVATKGAVAAVAPFVAIGAVAAGTYYGLTHRAGEFKFALEEIARTSNEELIPTLEKIIALGGFDELVGELVDAGDIATLQRLGEVVELNAKDQKLLEESIVEVKRAFEQEQANADATAAALGQTGDAADVTAGSQRQLAAATYTAADAARDQARALSAMFGSVYGVTDASHDLDKAVAGYTDSLNGSTSAGGRAESQADRLADKKRKVAEANRDAAEAELSLRDATEDLTQAQKELDKALKGPTEKDKTKSADDVTEARLSLEDATFAVEDAQKKLTEAQRAGDPSEIARATNDLEQAQLRRRQAQEALTAAQTAYNAVANWTAETDEKVAEAQLKVRDATEAATGKWLDLQDATRKANEAQNESIAGSAGSAAGLDSSRGSLFATKDAWLQVRGSVIAYIEAILAAELATASTLKEFDLLKEKVMNIPGLSPEQRGQLTHAITRGRQAATGSLFTPGFPGYASGTSDHPGGMAWVGERGKELVNLPAGSQVIPNGRATAAGAAPVVVYLTVQSLVPPHPADLGRQLQGYLNEYAKAGG